MKVDSHDRYEMYMCMTYFNDKVVITSVCPSGDRGYTNHNQ